RPRPGCRASRRGPGRRPSKRRSGPRSPASSLLPALADENHHGLRQGRRDLARLEHLESPARGAVRRQEVQAGRAHLEMPLELPPLALRPRAVLELEQALAEELVGGHFVVAHRAAPAAGLALAISDSRCRTYRRARWRRDLKAGIEISRVSAMSWDGISSTSYIQMTSR